MSKKHIIEISYNIQPDIIRKRQRKTTVMKVQEDVICKTGYKTIKQWHKQTKVQQGRRKDGGVDENMITFKKEISMKDVVVGLTLLYNTIIRHADPTMSYTTFHMEYASRISQCKHSGKCTSLVSPLFKAASVAAFYDPNHKVLRRCGGFKNLVMGPYLINLFHRASVERNDGLMYCFIYTMLSWTNFSVGSYKGRYTVSDLIQTPDNHTFQIYYRFVDLLERIPSMDMNVVRNVLAFKKMSYLSREALVELLRLYRLRIAFEHFLDDHNLGLGERGRLNALWNNVDYSVDEMISLHEMFEAHSLVSKACEIIIETGFVMMYGRLYFADMANHIGGDVSPQDIIYDLLSICVSPSLDVDTACIFLTGLETNIDTHIVKMRSRVQAHLKHTIETRSYNDHVQISEREKSTDDFVTFNIAVIEQYIENLEHQALPKVLGNVDDKLYLSDVHDRSELYTSMHLDFPIYSTLSGDIYTTNNSFFLPIQSN